MLSSLLHFYIPWTLLQLNDAMKYWPLTRQFPNKRSLTRDELSNERSFLAFVRMGVSILVVLFGISQLVGEDLIKAGIKHILEGQEVSFNAKLRLYRRAVRPILLFLCSVSCFVFIWAFKRFIKNLFLISDKSNISADTLGFGFLCSCLVAFDAVILYIVVRYGTL